MYRRSSLILLVVLACSVPSSQLTEAKRGASSVLGQSVELHSGCDAELPQRCREGFTLTFGPTTNGAALLAVDIVPRYEGQGHANPPTTIEMLVTLRVPTVNQTALPGMTLRMDHRPYPLATRIDDRGTLVALVPFTDFVRLANAPTITGHVFDREFTASAKQMALLRFIAGRWAAGESMSPN